MKSDNQKLSQPELRFDPISENWIIIAPSRAQRPETFKKKKTREAKTDKSKCPFCNLAPDVKPTLVYNKGKKIKIAPNDITPKNWTTIVIPNKYPAVTPFSTRTRKKTIDGIYQKAEAAGFHEVVITRSHTRHFAQFTLREIKELIDVFQERYKDLMKQEFVNNIFIYHNHGRQAGASISHPHSQIITMPFIDIDLNKKLLNFKRFFQRHGKCLSCALNDKERKEKKRIVFENKSFLALCPFAPRAPFQVIISPKKHSPYFAAINKNEKKDLARVFQAVFQKINKGLNDPPYNFYLYASPTDGKKYPFHHWHWAILPKTNVPAGFELGAKMEILTVSPETAAEYLRKQSV